MNLIVGHRVSQATTRARLRRRIAGLLLCLAGSGAWAATASGAPNAEATSTLMAQSEIADPGERPRPQMEVSTTSLPRFDTVDGTTHSSRLDMTWLPPRRSALGLAVGMTSMHGSMLPAAAPFAGSSTSVDLGLHWRYTLDSNYRIDVTAWRRVVPPDALSLVHNRQPSYGARVEMRIGPASKTGLVADRGFLGFQLESGARITLRRSGGKPMIYYRSKF